MTDDWQVFIQWKATDVFAEFDLPCGHAGYYDGYFMYYLECPICERVYEVGSEVTLTEVPRPEIATVVQMMLD